MKILAVETSGRVSGVCLWADGQILANSTIHTSLTHSEKLMPQIDTILRACSMEISMLDAFAVSMGPGSFTGLRIGAATVLGLAFPQNTPIIGVSTLEALCYHAPFSNMLLCPIMDARRGQVYNALYRFSDGLQVVENPRAIFLEELLESLPEPALFMGDGVAPNKQLLKGQAILPIHQCLPDASCIAMAAMQKIGVPPVAFQLEYVRASQAERNLQ